jgi:hypothetical protein
MAAVFRSIFMGIWRFCRRCWKKVAQRWVTAVNNLKDCGKWEFVVCRDVDLLLGKIGEMLGAEVVPVSLKKEGDLF